MNEIVPSNENFGLRVIREGSWGTVSLIAGTAGVQCGGEGVSKIKYNLNSKKMNLGLKMKWLGEGKQIQSIADDYHRAHFLVDHGNVGVDDLEGLPKGVHKESDLLALAKSFGVVVYRYRRKEKDGGIRDPRPIGMILSDFLEVIDSRLAARILFAASNPDISETIKEGDGALGKRGPLGLVDVQQHAVGAVLLLPQKKRVELFGEMAKLGPGKEGRARRFFSIITANWNNTKSPFCGPRILVDSLNLAGGAGEKISEFQNGISEVVGIIKAQGGEW